MRPGAARGVAVGLALALLVAATVSLQAVRERRYPPREGVEEALYLRSGATIRRMVLSYDALAADLYWIRALQHYGRGRLTGGAHGYELLYPLLDITTTLDPRFSIAYRFGAIFLAEPPPGGPGRPDLAIALLEKGIRAEPDRWEYRLDIGFVHYWQLSDFPAAARWFRLAAEVPGSPPWLTGLAAAMLAQGGDRAASRFLWQQLYETAEHDWLRRSAERRLLQLQALDEIERLQALARAYGERHPAAAMSWERLIAAGLLRGTPVDPVGTPYRLDPEGAVGMAAESPLSPLPVEPRAGPAREQP